MGAINPFEITKAVDFTDDEIESTFVDYPEGGFRSFAAPSSAMAKFLVGGKGGGRTHLMRFYSYALRKRSAGPVIPRLRKDGYLGIYFRCSGLNASRFGGKGIASEAWSAVFSFYMDVWLTEQLVDVLIDVNDIDKCWSRDSQAVFARNVLAQLSYNREFISGSANELEDLRKLRDILAGLRKDMDRSINNAAIRARLDIEIGSNPGRLVFAASLSAHDDLPGLDGLHFTYLIDEFENLSRDQQMYVNTLIREKDLPTSFLIGSRRWGVRTHQTLSAGEENKRGSEFEWVELENNYRHTGNSYSEFCVQLALKRLKQAGHGGFQSEADLQAVLPSLEWDGSDVEHAHADRLGDLAALALLKNTDPRLRKHLLRLQQAVANATKMPKMGDQVVELISRPGSPMSEKLAIHRFYQSWSAHGSPTLGMAAEAAEEADSIRNGSSSAKSNNYLGLWRGDLLAQIYMDSDKRAPYLGVGRFIEMSGYLPRSFLMTMKYVTQAALVRGQSPYEVRDAVSPAAQMAGVLEASQWFLRDSRPTEGLGGECERAIRRLATLFNRVRYSDKPVEVSCIAISTDFFGLSQRVISIVDTCVSHSLLIEVAGGRSARNEGSTWHKYQLHPMLSPGYALPTTRRGELTLNPNEMRAIFDPEVSDRDYAITFRPKLRSMMAPFTDGATIDPAQAGLF